MSIMPNRTFLSLVFRVSMITSLIAASPTAAQLIPDTTLGSEASLVTPNAEVRGLPADLIQGGATRGANLYHSFSEFNIGDLQRVYFANPTGIESILTRVTGTNPSNILGTLGVDGGASLFLINPHGILFGANAKLEIAGSFTASTADSFLLPDGNQFSATNPQAPPLLTVNVAIGLQSGGTNPEAWLTGHMPSSPNPLLPGGEKGAMSLLPSSSLGEGQGVRGNIANQGNLTVGAGQTLTLYGNTVISSGTLIAPGGTVQLLGNQVGLFDQAVVKVSSPTGGGRVLIGGDFQGKGTVPTASRTYVSPDAVINADALETGNGGTVIVWADETTRFYGTIAARGAGQVSGSDPDTWHLTPNTFSNGGFVEVSGKEYLDFQGQVDTSAPFGQVGTLLLDPTNIEVVALLGNTFNTSLAFGDAPFPTARVASTLMTLSFSNIVLQATNDITVNAGINLLTPGVGFTAQAGNNIVVNRSITTNGGATQLIANDASSGAASGTGAIAINNAELRSRGGNMLFRAAGDVLLNAVAGTVVVLTEDQFGGKVGNLTVETNGTLRIQATVTTDYAQIGTGAFGAGNAGDVTIAADRVEISRPANSIADTPTGIFSRSQGSGEAGNITIATNQLVLTNDSEISAETLGPGDAGNIAITTNQLLADNDSRIGASTLGSGNAGIIDITTNQLIAANGTQIGAGTFGAGDAGAVIVRAYNVELLGTDLNGSPSGIFAPNTPGSTGDSGRVEITTDRLILHDGGRVSVATNNNRDGGNLTIQARDIELSGVGATGSPSRLDAGATNTATGNAGEITIDTARLLVQDSAQINTDSQSGNAGNQTIRATEGITLLNSGTLVSRSTTGNGGDISLRTGQLQMQDKGFIATASSGDGRSGNVTIQATGAIALTDESQIATASLGGGQSGNVTVQADGAIDLTDNSAITNLSGRGIAGNLQITTPNLTLQNHSRIVTGSITGTAGNLQLDVFNGILIQDSSFILASGLNGGSINLKTGQLQIQNGGAIAANNVTPSSDAAAPGRAGNVNIQVRENVIVSDSSSIFAAASQGDGGTLKIASRNLTLQNRSSIAANTILTGNAGNVTVQTRDSILIQRSTLGTISFQVAGGGTVKVSTDNLTLTDNGVISTGIVGAGNGGDLEVTASNITVESLGSIGTTVLGQGKSGNLSIQADTITVNNGSLSTSAIGSGSGGKLTVNSNTLDILNQGSVNTASLDINALDLATDLLPEFSNLIVSNPVAASLFNNARSTATNAVQGDSGELVVRVRDAITITNEGQVSTLAQGSANSGRLTVQTSDLSITNDGLLISTIQGQGRGGDITVQANNLLLTNQGEISSRGEQQGAAANITINLANTFNARDGLITATSTQAGGGNINVQANDIRLRDSSLISTSVFDSTGGGGNITLNSTIFLALEDSDILANAERGPGGDITINSPGFLANLFTQSAATPVGRNPGSFGQFRGNGRVDISADSAAGRSGTINLPNVDPSTGLVPLPDGLADASNQIAQTCKPGQRATSSLVNIGRGGIPETPYDSRSTDEVWEDLGGKKEEGGRRAETDNSEPLTAIVEARVVQRDAQGQVMLVATPQGVMRLTCRR